MAFPISPKRFALLIGIDLYFSGSSRKDENEIPISLGNLRGCLNDVQGVAELLRDEFHLKEPRILTSSLPSSNFNCAVEPTKRLNCQPTFSNIKREFDYVAEQANPGDFFWFHFSGHGARLPPTKRSPRGRSDDPSLLTVDFCCGGPAVRGWQLNEWLQMLNRKKVRIIVILDSCYSGGAWRGGGQSFRTPKDLTSVPNLLCDEEAVAETEIKFSTRNMELEKSWSINPEHFTLMAACGSGEPAAEKIVHGAVYGAFTYEFLTCLKENRPSQVMVTYQNLRDQITERLRKTIQQTPRVYGRDRLLVFGDQEPFLVTPLVVHVRGERVYIPIGKLHGVRERSEFTTYPPTPQITFSADHVETFECSALIPSRLHKDTLEQHHSQIIQRRWSLGDDTLKVLTNLGKEFQEALYIALQDKIIGNVEIVELNNNYLHDITSFRLTKSGNNIDLTGSLPLVGYEGPVRGLDLTGNSSTQIATKSAVALAHLTRFGQILNLSDNATRNFQPFELSLSLESSMGCLLHNQEIKFTFKNTFISQLYFTLLAFGPGFHIKQIYPPEDHPKLLNSNDEISIILNVEIPNQLSIYNSHRDIIRIIAIKEKEVSWRSLELPDIWNANQLTNNNSLQRTVHLVHTSEYWVKDVYISLQKNTPNEIYWDL